VEKFLWETETLPALVPNFQFRITMSNQFRDFWSVKPQAVSALIALRHILLIAGITQAVCGVGPDSRPGLASGRSK
jgi:hypothetical protein